VAEGAQVRRALDLSAGGASGGCGRRESDRRVYPARLDREGLKPSPEADRRTLARRVALDLTGMPPTPEEIAAFQKDTSPNAYEKLVDRLLASPRYAEQQTMRWLDVVRYADTCGSMATTHSRPGRTATTCCMLSAITSRSMNSRANNWPAI
jgi:hypothetical protein